jgi:hypothetical protein
MISMQDEKKMPCFKEYDPQNYACSLACHLGGKSDTSVCAAATFGAEVPSAELTEVESMVEKVETPEPTQAAAVEPAAEAATPTATPAEAATPTATPAEVATEPAKEEPSSDSAEPTEASAEDTGTTASPDEVQAEPVKPGKKLSKKDVIRNALAESPSGIAADDIVTKIMDAGLITEAEVDKTRHYVIMSISHMRKAGKATGKTIELKEGKYVLTGDQSE